MSEVKSKVLPEGKYVDLSAGMKLHYHDLGSGFPVLFLQGSGSGASGWSNFQFNAPAFTEAGFRCLLIDLPGYGYSSKPTDVNYTLDYFVAYINEFLEKIGVDKLAIVGNSLGGALAIGFALKYPKKAEKLILMAPGGVEEKADYFTMPGMAIMKEVFMGGATSRDKLAEFVRRGLVYDAKSASELLIDQRWEVFQLQNDHVLKTMEVPNMTARLGEINCPVLVLWGINDNMMPTTGILKLAQGLKNMRMVIQSECGHWFMIEHTELFNKLSLDFLKEKELKEKAVN
jgi:4,5:9,10-diseco-3-hydroxy-5,9,17-trioxoandrosta-1(10),2-diene-4-oate hydrolase